MLTARHPHRQVWRVGSDVPSTSHVPRAVRAEAVSWLARSRSYVDERRRIVALANVAAAGLFVAGCIGFYWPGLYSASVTLFLCGSVLFLLGALASALLECGLPSGRVEASDLAGAGAARRVPVRTVRPRSEPG